MTMSAESRAHDDAIVVDRHNCEPKPARITLTAPTTMHPLTCTHRHCSDCRERERFDHQLASNSIMTNADAIEAEFNSLLEKTPHVAASLSDLNFARRLDGLDVLAHSKSLFNIPRSHPYNESGPPSIYLCGNSLGAQPRLAAEYIAAEMSKWATAGVEGHFLGERPWVTVDEPCNKLIAPVVGASVDEVATLNSLSVNLHLLLISFYRPTAVRYRIIIEEAAFCSDHHVIRSQITLHNRNVDDTLIQLKPRQGEYTLRTEDIVATIHEHRDLLALVMLPGVQFYTGQFFDIPTITAAAHAAGAYAGWDLAHAVGNLPLSLHDWQVDFASWCTYKYLNAGPGSISGIFFHSSHHNSGLPKLSGWWGQTPTDRFVMAPNHKPIIGAQAYQCSNPPVLPAVCLQASLETIRNVGGMQVLREKSQRLTTYLSICLRPLFKKYNIIQLTSNNIHERGCQLSLLLNKPIKPILKLLEHHSIICDGREPNVIRIAPTPLYNTFEDISVFIRIFTQILDNDNITNNNNNNSVTTHNNNNQVEDLQKEQLPAVMNGDLTNVA